MKYTPRFANEIWDAGEKNGGYLVTYNDNGNQTYIRMTGYLLNENSFYYIGQEGHLLTTNYSYTFVYGFKVQGHHECYAITNEWHSSDAHTLRCIQEKE